MVLLLLHHLVIFFLVVVYPTLLQAFSGCTQPQPSRQSFLSTKRRRPKKHPSLPRTLSTTTTTTTTTALFGINEWRDFAVLPAESSYTSFVTNPQQPQQQQQQHSEVLPSRPICLLPFPFPELLLQGETKQLRLYEDRFLKLFDYVMENHGGVVGMGLLADSSHNGGGGGILEMVPLCEIEAYNRMGDGFGVFVTIRVVGRAQLLDITHQEPFIRAVCVEAFDQPILLEQHQQQQHDKLQTVVDNMEDNIWSMADYDQQLHDLLSVKDEYDIDFMGDDDEDEDDDDDDDEDEEIYAGGRSREDQASRYVKAQEAALRYDSQGYTTLSSSSSSSSLDSIQDMTAKSWAAFGIDASDEDRDLDDAGLGFAVLQDDVSLRVRALDSTDLYERLRLAELFVRRRHRRLGKTLRRERQRLRNGSSSKNSRETDMDYDYYNNMDGEEDNENDNDDNDDDDDDDDGVDDIFFR